MVSCLQQIQQTVGVDGDWDAEDISETRRVSSTCEDAMYDYFMLQYGVPNDRRCVLFVKTASGVYERVTSTPLLQPAASVTCPATMCSRGKRGDLKPKQLVHNFQTLIGNSYDSASVTVFSPAKSKCT